MSESNYLGQQGEAIASQFLSGKGYNIVCRNWRAGANEIDIIAENGEFIVFIEVKTRSGNYVEHPRAAVAASKQKAIIRTADEYIRKYDINKECRFDIITVVINNGTPEIVHIEDAFYPTLK